MLFLNFNTNQENEKNVKMFLPELTLATVTPEKLKPFFDNNFIIQFEYQDNAINFEIYCGNDFIGYTYKDKNLEFIGDGYLKEIKTNHLIINDNLSNFVDNFCLFDHTLYQ